MNYINYINDLLKKEFSDKTDTVLFGQNIGTGSCLSGLTRGIELQHNSTLLNTPNCENTLVGVGMGLMLGGVNATYFVKQLDFTILGLDQMLNTYNLLRIREQNAAFNIFAIVVDSGYEGGQASFNNVQGMSALCDIPCYSIQSKQDADYIIQDLMPTPGFRIICVSQRMFRETLIRDAIELPTDMLSVDRMPPQFTRYSNGADAAIVCFNFSLPYGIEIENYLQSKSKASSLFSVNCTQISDWSSLTNELINFERVLLIDDSKSPSISINDLKANLKDQPAKGVFKLVRQNKNNDWYKPSSEVFEYDLDNIYQDLFDSQ